MWIGLIILIGSLYMCGVFSTRTFILTLPLYEQNGYVIHHPRALCFTFPFSAVLTVPMGRGYRGYWGYYFACYVMLAGSLMTWCVWAVAFLFLPASWWYFAGMCFITFIAGLFVSKDMENCMKSVGHPLFPPQVYIPPREKKNDNDMGNKRRKIGYALAVTAILLGVFDHSITIKIFLLIVFFFLLFVYCKYFFASNASKN